MILRFGKQKEFLVIFCALNLNLQVKIFDHVKFTMELKWG